MFDFSQMLVPPGVFLESMTESVLVTTAPLEAPGPFIVYVNPAFERMTGWSRREVLGLTPRILQGPKTDHSIFAAMGSRLEREQVWEGQAVNYRKDGSEFVMEWSIVPVRDAVGEVGHYLAVQRDVTARVALERKLEEARLASREWSAKLERTNQRLSALNHEQRRTLDLFVKYVPEPVVERALSAKGEPALGQGELLEVAVLFCDLRNFTGLTSELSPPRTVSLLNTYYGMMSEVIQAHGGVIQQFVGDEIFVTFGAPLPIEKPAIQAVRCALAMVRQLDRINAVLGPLVQRSVQVKIGLNYGPVVAGNLGSAQRLAYSITGDTVNTAKRIESLGVSGVNPILAGEALYDLARGQFRWRAWAPVRVKGKREELLIFEVLGAAEE